MVGRRTERKEEFHFGGVAITIPMKSSCGNKGTSGHTHVQLRRESGAREVRWELSAHRWFAKACKLPRCPSETAQTQKRAQSHFLSHRGRRSKRDQVGNQAGGCINAEAKREEHFKEDEYSTMSTAPERPREMRTDISPWVWQHGNHRQQ